MSERAACRVVCRECRMSECSVEAIIWSYKGRSRTDAIASSHERQLRWSYTREPCAERKKCKHGKRGALKPV